MTLVLFLRLLLALIYANICLNFEPKTAEESLREVIPLVFVPPPTSKKKTQTELGLLIYWYFVTLATKTGKYAPVLHS